MSSRSLVLSAMGPAEFPRTWEKARAAIGEGVCPGLVAGIWRLAEPGIIRVMALGERRRVPSAQPMEPDTVFDLASVSKVMGTATLAASLVERRWIDWDTPLAAILPGYSHKDILIRHLLSHTAGFVAWQPFWERLRERFPPGTLHEVPVSDRQRAMRELVTAVAPDARPGARCLYSDVSFLLLGFALEEVTSMPLDRAVRELLWKPMGIRGAFYRRVTASAADGRLDRVAATEDCPWRKAVLQGQVHDDNCWAMGGYGGHAGAFGSARDVLEFARALCEGFLSRETLKTAWTRVERPVGCDRTPGWDTPSGEEPAAGRRFSPSSVGHLGFTGTSLWIDPEAGVAVTLLTNRVHPSRENTLIRAFRPRFHEAIRDDLAGQRR